jgi:hypothetical protein
MRKAVLYFFVALLYLPTIAQQTTLPTNLAWNNAVTNFNCNPNGVTDCTAQLRAAARAYPSPFLQNIVVYLPKGTYLISDSIMFRNDYFDKDVMFIGEDSAQTIIKLIDNAPGFQNANNPRAIFNTRAGNQAFGNYFKNLTINTGSGNPGAIGIDYITSNYGSIEHVAIKSQDGSGFAGITMERSWPGPGLIKNVTIDGFAYGVRIATCEYSMTMEHIYLKNQTTAAIFNNCNNLPIRKCVITNCPRPIINNGRMCVIDSKITGSNSNASAITSGVGATIFCRNVTTTGYTSALNANNNTIAGNNIVEYKTLPDNSQFTNNGRSLNIPIEETPEYYNNDLSTWAKANDYGAAPTNPIYATVDAGIGIQAALNSGAKVIYFDRMGDNGSGYCIYNDIIIPPTVEMLQGFQHARFIFFNNSKFVINQNGPPLFFNDIRATDVFNNSQRTVVFKGASLGTYTNSALNTNGKVFLEDQSTSIYNPTYPTKMWARQFNPELQPEADTAIVNNGGQYWILGLKTEGRATLISTYNGAKTEVIGGLILPASQFSATNNIAFVVNNACFSAVALTRTSYIPNGWYGITVRETQNGITRDFLTPGTAPAFYEFAFYASSQTPCSNILALQAKAIKANCNSNTIKISFNAQEKSSINYYAIQTSTNGINWVTASVILQQSAPNYNSAIATNATYKFVRLTQVNTNGSIEYYPAININCSNQTNITAYPTHFTNEIFIQTNNIATSILNLSVYNSNGALVAQQQVSTQPLIKIPTNHLSHGAYFLRVTAQNNNLLYSGKLIK